MTVVLRLLADIRNFGALSDTVEPKRVVTLLNCMFDAIVPMIEAEGGEVLKYIGDGVLAVFDAAGGDARARNAAFRSARAALAAVARTNDLPAIEIALHVGEVAYGNLGAGDRLDFTAIGQDVLVRVKALCRLFSRALLATGAFAEGLPLSLEPVDTVVLRGFANPYTLLGLQEETIWKGERNEQIFLLDCPSGRK
ncbi:MAG: adenylate/guanylate cyclase protein [Methylobacterium brachiatum]|nr:adenylate/guanylate cyclase protein [Methylobacterium brachiatum]